MLYMDYHVHLQNSPDSSEPLEEICKGAMDAGIKEMHDHRSFTRCSQMILGERHISRVFQHSVWSLCCSAGRN